MRNIGIALLLALLCWQCESADELEQLVDKKYWPFPTYADLLFEV